MRPDKAHTCPIVLKVVSPLSLSGRSFVAARYPGSIKTTGATVGSGVSWSAPTYWLSDNSGSFEADVTTLVLTGKVIVVG